MLDPNFAAAHWKAAWGWFGNATAFNLTILGEELSDGEQRARFLQRLNAAFDTGKDDLDKLRYTAALAIVELRLQDAHRLLSSYLEARPRDIEAWAGYSSLSAYVGDLKAVARAAERIHTLSVESGYPNATAITSSISARLPAKAVARARQQLALRPDKPVIACQAQQAFLWAGEIDAAKVLLGKVMASNLQEDLRLLAELRQSCAGQKYDEAIRMRDRIDQMGGLGVRWHAAQIPGDSEGADALLRPFDSPEGLCCAFS